MPCGIVLGGQTDVVGLSVVSQIMIVSTTATYIFHPLSATWQLTSGWQQFSAYGGSVRRNGQKDNLCNQIFDYGSLSLIIESSVLCEVKFSLEF